MKFKLSPSRLEAYRLFRCTDWMTEERLLEQLKGDFVETPQMRLGTAFHEVLENKGRQKNEAEYRFNNDDIQLCFGDIIENDQLLHEVSGSKLLTLGPNDAVKINTRADAVWGNKLYEFKTTESNIFPQKYIDSCQWKFCMYALDLKCAEYRIAQLAYSEEKNVWRIKNYDTTGKLYWGDNFFDEMRELCLGLKDFYFKHEIEKKILL